jgi:hypothetical protein
VLTQVIKSKEKKTADQTLGVMVVKFRLKEDEYETLKETADQQNETIEDYLRSLVLTSCKKNKKNKT